jgi:hypothetical protein
MSSINYASLVLEEFCKETGRTTPRTIQVVVFDFQPGSDDRKAFEEWGKNNDRWQRERREFGPNGTLGSHNRTLMEAASGWSDETGHKLKEYFPEEYERCIEEFREQGESIEEEAF